MTTAKIKNLEPKKSALIPNGHHLMAKNLSKTYHQRQILKDVSVDIRAGEIVGLLGPNGAGKTTCFYLILGIIAPDNGDIWLDKKEITQQPIHLRAQMGIGYLPQEASIFRKMTVEENILAILQTRTDLDKSAQILILEDLLKEFRVTHIRDMMGISLSGGERRRVEIARALAINPKFILLDEPFAGVDPISIIDIKNIIHLLSQKGIGILMTDHNVRDTLDICDRAYIVNQGKVISEGSTSHILQDSQVRKVYLGEDFTL
jgi:lipopolysaccharide export system ATP-binding protein